MYGHGQLLCKAVQDKFLLKWLGQVFKKTQGNEKK